jgi:hypothetical protein
MTYFCLLISLSLVYLEEITYLRLEISVVRVFSVSAAQSWLQISQEAETTSALVSCSLMVSVKAFSIVEAYST